MAVGLGHIKRAAPRDDNIIIIISALKISGAAGAARKVIISCIRIWDRTSHIISRCNMPSLYASERVDGGGGGGMRSARLGLIFFGPSKRRRMRGRGGRSLKYGPGHSS